MSANIELQKRREIPLLSWNTVLLHLPETVQFLTITEEVLYIEIIDTFLNLIKVLSDFRFQLPFHYLLHKCCQNLKLLKDDEQ